MSIIPKDQLRAIIKEYSLKDAKDIQEMLKKSFRRYYPGNTW